MPAIQVSIGSFARVAAHELREHSDKIAGGGDLNKVKVASFVGPGLATVTPFQSAGALRGVVKTLAEDLAIATDTREQLGGIADALAGARRLLQPVMLAKDGQVVSKEAIEEATQALRTTATSLDALQVGAGASKKVSFDASKLPEFMQRARETARHPQAARGGGGATPTAPRASTRPAPGAGAGAPSSGPPLDPEMQARFDQLNSEVAAEAAEAAARRARDIAAQQRAQAQAEFAATQQVRETTSGTGVQATATEDSFGALARDAVGAAREQLGPFLRGLAERASRPN